MRSQAEITVTLTYSTIFLISLISALVALYLYRLISNAGKSIYRSKQRISRSNEIMGFQNNKAANTLAGTMIHSGRNRRVTTRNMASKHPAVPQAHRQQGSEWPYREDKPVNIGSAYKVKRKAVTRTSDRETESKPWGW
jgi:hypothetical protein